MQNRYDFHLPSMKRLKQILLILAVNGLVLAAGLAVLELIFGEWLDIKKLNRLNLVRDCVRHHNVSELYHAPDPIIRYSRDKYGLRGSYDTPREIDILTVGGSTTDQRYIDDGKTWQKALQKHLRQAGINMRVANAGVDGQSTYGHLKNFEWWFPFIPGLNPDYILFYVGLNDFHKNAENPKDLLIKEKSALWYMFRTLRGTYEAKIIRQIGHRSINFAELEWTGKRLQEDYSFMEPRLTAYARRLRKLVDLTREMGAEPVFVSQPSRKYKFTPEKKLWGNSAVNSYDDHPYNGVDYYYMIRKLDSVTKAVAAEKKVPFIDAGGYHEWTDADFYDFEHMTPQGSEKLGILLSNQLKKIIAAAAESDEPGG